MVSCTVVPGWLSCASAIHFSTVVAIEPVGWFHIQKRQEPEPGVSARTSNALDQAGLEER